MKRPRPAPAAHGIAAWVRLLPQTAMVSFGIAGLRFIETLVSPPPLQGAPLLAVALVAGSLYWLSGVLLGALALIAWAVNRALGHQPPEPAVPPVVWSREARLRGRGFSIVAGWVGLSMVVAIVMSDTRTGPFAWFATDVLGLRGLASIATFLLALPCLLSPLLLLALLPWQTRWPLVTGMQGAVKLSSSSPSRRRKRR